MDIPTEREQRSDFRQWQRELRSDDTGLNGEYTAPDRTTRFLRAFKYWFVPYEERRGPTIESFTPINTDGTLTTKHELIEPDDDGVSFS